MPVVETDRIRLIDPSWSTNHSGAQLLVAPPGTSIFTSRRKVQSVRFRLRARPIVSLVQPVV